MSNHDGEGTETLTVAEALEGDVPVTHVPDVFQRDSDAADELIRQGHNPAGDAVWATRSQHYLVEEGFGA